MFLLEYFFHSFQSVMSVSKYTALRDFLQVGNFTFCHFQEVIHQQSIAFSFWKFLQGLHRQKLARMILENKWYEADTVQDSGFFTDLQSRSREKIVWFPKIYYQMEKGLLHIRCEITLGKYQDQLLRLEDSMAVNQYGMITVNMILWLIRMQECILKVKEVLLVS